MEAARTNATVNGSRETAKGAMASGCPRAETLRGAREAELAAGATPSVAKRDISPLAGGATIANKSAGELEVAKKNF